MNVFTWFTSCSLAFQVTFKVTIQTQDCPENPEDRLRRLQINVVGLSDHLDIEVEHICECPCEQKDFPPLGNLMPPVRWFTVCYITNLFVEGVLLNFFNLTEYCLTIHGYFTRNFPGRLKRVLIALTWRTCIAQPLSVPILLQEENSAMCNTSGNFNCGGCTCNEGFYGHTCECRGGGLDDVDQEGDLSVCRRFLTNITCSGFRSRVTLIHTHLRLAVI